MPVSLAALPPIPPRRVSPLLSPKRPPSFRMCCSCLKLEPSSFLPCQTSPLRAQIGAVIGIMPRPHPYPWPQKPPPVGRPSNAFSMYLIKIALHPCRNKQRLCRYRPPSRWDVWHPFMAYPWSIELPSLCRRQDSSKPGNLIRPLHCLLAFLVMTPYSAMQWCCSCLATTRYNCGYRSGPSSFRWLLP